MNRLETYKEQKVRHHKELGDFEGIFFAFSDDQFNEGLKKVGLSETDSPSQFIYSIGAGGYILKTKSKDFRLMLKKHKEERKSLKKDNKRLLDALVYELNNHEYGFTGDPSDALQALGLSSQDIEPKLLKEAFSITEKGGLS